MSSELQARDLRMKQPDLAASTTAATPRRSAIAVVVLSACFFAVGTAGTAAATMPGFNESATPDTTPATDPPVDTSPADTSPADTSPADTSPADTEVLDGETVQEEDEGLDVAPIALVGFVILIAVAGWWMVRRDDADDQPSPPPAGEPQWRPDQVAP